MKWVIDSLLALLCTLFLPFLIGEQGETGLLYPAAFAVLTALFHSTHWRGSNRRRVLFSHLAGAVFAVLLAFGAHLEKQGAVPYESLAMWLAIACYAHVLGQALSLLWSALDGQKPLQNQLTAVLDRFLCKPWLVAMVMLLCWLPCYLSTYPGNFVYDATKEFSQLEKGFMGDFPQLHSWLITSLLKWSHENTGGYNAGIAVFTISQMAVLAAMFSHMVWAFRRQGVSPVVNAVAVLWWAAFPAVHVLVTSTVRDVLFSGLLTYSVFLLWCICRERKRFLQSWWRPVGAALVLVLTVFSRNNNSGPVMPVALCAVGAVLFLVGGRRGWKGALAFSAAALASFFLLQNGLDFLCPIVSRPSVNASMTVYSQSLARAYALEGETWSAGEKLSMVRHFDLDRLRYVPENGDASKGRLRLDSEEEAAEFMEFWRLMGKRYPRYYADAILLNTRAMWYPGAVMRGYQQAGVGMYKEYEKCWFFFADSIEEPGVLESKLPKVHDWYRDLSLNISFEKIPVAGLLFSVGFHFWLLLHCVFYSLYRKRRQVYLPLLLLVVYTLASAFVPLMLLRYFAALIFAFPLVMVFTLQHHQKQTEN